MKAGSRTPPVSAPTQTPLPAENSSTGKGPNATGPSSGELPREKRHDGFDLHQVERVGPIAIYEKTNGRYQGWEIILIRKRPARRLPNGKYIASHEHYPSSAEWGMRGWTAMTLAEAKKRFNELVKRYGQSH